MRVWRSGNASSFQVEVLGSNPGTRSIYAVSSKGKGASLITRKFRFESGYSDAGKAALTRLDSEERLRATGRCRLARHLLWGQDQGSSILPFPTNEYWLSGRAPRSGRGETAFDSQVLDWLFGLVNRAQVGDSYP